MSQAPQDQIRQKIQLIIAVLFIGGAYAVVATFIFIKGFNDSLVIEIVKQFVTLIILGVGAALAIFGLGRKVS